MTRDVHDAEKQAKIQLFRVWEDDGYEELQSESTRNYLSTYRSRGDLVQSNHIAATPYQAERYSAFPVSFHRWTSGTFYGFHPILGGLKKYKLHQIGEHAPSNYGEGRLSAANVPQSVQTAAATACRAQCSTADVNVGQLFAEMPEALRMIASNAVTVLQAYRALRRGKLSKIPKILGVEKVKDLPKGAANVWFAYKFGWEPLVRDTYNLHSAVSKALNLPTLHKVKETRVGKPAISGHTWSTETEQNAQAGCTVGVTYMVKDETLAGLNSLGLLNPVQIAWEAVPLSFVVDWFVPVGSFLQAMSAPLGLQFVSGYKTVFVYHDYLSRDETNGFYSEGENPSIQVKAFAFERSPLASWPVPGLYVRTDLNLNQLATLSGLLAQRA